MNTLITILAFVFLFFGLMLFVKYFYWRRSVRRSYFCDDLKCLSTGKCRTGACR